MSNMNVIASVMKEAGYSADECARALAALAGIGTGTTAKADTRKGAPKELVDFVKRDGTVKRVSAAQAAAWEKGRNRWEENQNAEVAAQVRAAKAREPELTRALEKALGIKAGSLKNTACTAEQARALGWKGTRAELKAIKARIRA